MGRNFIGKVPTRQVVIVSGGSRGLGLAIVQRLLQSGRMVAAFSRSRSEQIDRLLADDRFRESLKFRQVDAANSAELVTFVKYVEREFGRIDALKAYQMALPQSGLYLPLILQSP